jgi:hypothetical protein
MLRNSPFSARDYPSHQHRPSACLAIDRFAHDRHRPRRGFASPSAVLGAGGSARRAAWSAGRPASHRLAVPALRRAELGRCHARTRRSLEHGAGGLRGPATGAAVMGIGPRQNLAGSQARQSLGIAVAAPGGEQLGPHARGRDRTARRRRVRSTRVRHPARAAPGGRRRIGKSWQQGPARTAPSLRGQVCGLTAAARLGRVRAPHDSPKNSFAYWLCAYYR